jgi:hypothetical protein
LSHCKYPDCSESTYGTWALVPLCKAHFEAIHKETFTYYRLITSKNEKRERPNYTKIAHLIPWSKMRLKAGDWK